MRRRRESIRIYPLLGPRPRNPGSDGSSFPLGEASEDGKTLYPRRKKNQTFEMDDSTSYKSHSVNGLQKHDSRSAKIEGYMKAKHER